MAALAILFSGWSMSKKSSPLKLPGQMNQNLVGSIYMYGRFLDASYQVSLIWSSGFRGGDF
jgi:hypothetical protein